LIVNLLIFFAIFSFGLQIILTLLLKKKIDYKEIKTVIVFETLLILAVVILLLIGISPEAPVSILTGCCIALHIYFFLYFLGKNKENYDEDYFVFT
jgi:hypothetical protein